MSRLMRSTVCVPHDVKVMIKDHAVSITGNFGVLVHRLHDMLDCKQIGENLILSFREATRLINGKSLLGTTYALFRVMILGVSVGFVKKLQLFGVGYRATINGNIVTLVVGFSHVITYKVPDGVGVVCPNLTDIILSSANKQLLGQVAADLRAIRPPEPFSGKGIRYENEIISIKDVKKK